jgi:hypothetical protein
LEAIQSIFIGLIQATTNILCGTQYDTHRSIEICRAVAIPLRSGWATRHYAGSLVCAKPIGRRLLLQLTIRFGLVFAEQTRKVSATGSAIAIIFSLFRWMLRATRAVFTPMAVWAGSNRLGHDCFRWSSLVLFQLFVWLLESVFSHEVSTVHHFPSKLGATNSYIWIRNALRWSDWCFTPS